MTKNLLTPILDGGIANTHFFNGRLLTADALRDEQDAQRHQHEALGRAVGSGIVSGLNVSPSVLAVTGNVVHVDGGLAINRKGQPLTVPDSGLELTLLTSTDATLPEAGLFANCATPTTDTVDLPLNAYLLVLSPASGYQGKAPMHGLNDQGTINGCGSRYEVAGIQFRLVGLDVDEFEGISEATREQINELLASDDDNSARLAQLQNLLAHLCFGTEEVSKFAVDPFTQINGESNFLKYGAADSLGLDECDVPLALLHITSRGIRFVDNWAVRRRVTPEPLSPLWPLSTGKRRLAENEAVFLQFQAQMSQIIQTGSADGISAQNYFRYLPAAGLLPMRESGFAGIDVETFFNDIPMQPDFFALEGAQMIPLLKAAQQYPPIDLSLRQTLWLYRVRENVRSEKGQPYVLFTSGEIIPLVDERYDVNRWDHFYFRGFNE